MNLIQIGPVISEPIFNANNQTIKSFLFVIKLYMTMKLQSVVKKAFYSQFSTF